MFIILARTEEYHALVSVPHSTYVAAIACMYSNMFITNQELSQKHVFLCPSLLWSIFFKLFF